MVTLKSDAKAADVRKAVRMITGVETVSPVRHKRPKRNYNVITPELEAIIEQAREEYARGETIHCGTAEEMQAFFDSL